MKKNILTILIVSLIISLFSCGKQENSDKTSDVTSVSAPSSHLSTAAQNGNTSSESTTLLSTSASVSEKTTETVTTATTKTTTTSYDESRMAGGRDFSPNGLYHLMFSEKEYSDWLSGKSDKLIVDNDEDCFDTKIYPIYDNPSAKSVWDIASERNNYLLSLNTYVQSPNTINGKIQIDVKFCDFYKDIEFFEIHSIFGSGNIRCSCYYFNSKYDHALEKGIPALAKALSSNSLTGTCYPLNWLERPSIETKQLVIYDNDSESFAEVEAYCLKNGNEKIYWFIFKDCLVSLSFENESEEENIGTVGFKSVDYKKYVKFWSWWDL